MRHLVRLGSALVVSTAVMTTAILPADASAARLGPQRTAQAAAVRFAESAYQWRAAWYTTSDKHVHWIGPRVQGITSSKFDAVLDRTIIGPDSSANQVNWTAKSVTVLRMASPSHHTKKLKLTVHLVETDKGSTTEYPFTAPATVRVHESHGVWRANGAYLVDTYGPSKYCHNTPEATARCAIFP